MVQVQEPFQGMMGDSRFRHVLQAFLEAALTTGEREATALWVRGTRRILITRGGGEAAGEQALKVSISRPGSAAAE